MSKSPPSPAAAPDPALPFPTSLCHRCAAPPRYITSARGSVFIMCPLLPNKYPPQPVRSCALFRPTESRPNDAGNDAGSGAGSGGSGAAG